MKWRNQVLALVCLALFGAFGVFYFRTWVVQKPFAIILFVGEGLTSQRLASARLFRGGADSPLTIDELPYSARLRNFSEDFAVPDSAAAAAALASGVRIKNGNVAANGDGAGRTLLDWARARGRSTGFVTDGSLRNPTAAAFLAETEKRMSEGGGPDLVFGGGGRTSVNGNLRVIHRLAEMDELPAWQRPHVLGSFAEGDFPFADDATARAEKPSLAEMVRAAIAFLQQNRRGYVLVVDAHLMGAAASQNAGERTLRETIELDRAVQTALEYAGEDAALVVAGDVAIGGMNISGFPYRKDSGAAILGLNSAGLPWITWATGPNARASKLPSTGESTAAEPAALSAATAMNTLEDPIVSASGWGTENIRGTLDNTDLFALLRDAL